MIDVLCCCKPENVMGQVSMSDGLDAGLELRSTVDEDGNEGEAFVYDGDSGSIILSAAKKGTRRKPTRRTWREK